MVDSEQIIIGLQQKLDKLHEEFEKCKEKKKIINDRYFKFFYNTEYFDFFLNYALN